MKKGTLSRMVFEITSSMKMDSDGKPEKKYVQVKIYNLEKENQLRKII
jgi:hypothetical protein